MSEVKSLKSDLSGDLSDYLIAKHLPSNFRSYGDIKELYVRGLYYTETLSLAKYVDPNTTLDFAQLAILYKDVIKGIDIRDLEPRDFIILMTVSSIWTQRDHGWIPNVPCSATLKSGDPCDGTIVEKIILDDLKFEEPLFKGGLVPLTIRGKECQVGVVTVGDLIDKKDFLDNQESLDPDLKTIASYATLIKNDDLSFEDKIKLIKFADAKDIHNLKQLDSEMFIKIEPVLKKCPKCGHVNKLYIGIRNIRGFP